MLKSRYPKIHILSKNELAKHISHEKFPPKEALALVNDVKENFDKYWKDSKSSQPDKNKYVRNASRTPLGILLKKINTQVLAPHDNLIPGFIFGGVKKMNHKAAAQNLLGNKRQRTILKMDISTFFERIKRERVFHFFYTKCQCSMSAANLLADFCCVPLGAKSAPSKDKSIGRGFATSSRLAVWCNLDTFIKIQRLVNKELKNNDPRISVYVDDIGITASRVTKQKMEDLRDKILKILEDALLPAHPKKTEIISHEEGIEHLGLRLHRNKLTLGKKTFSKIAKTKNALKSNLSKKEKEQIRNKRRSLMRYKSYIEEF